MNAVILGYGVVGKGIEILTNSLDDINIKYVYVRKEKENLPYFSNNEDMVVQDDIDIVFECLNGLEPANTLIQKALKKGKHVISSNKAVVATYLDTYLELEKEYGGSIQVEACVAGGIPFIDALLKLKRLEPLQGYEGIFNGTSNYILDSMQKNNLDFEDVLKQAQEKGYAEKDPSNDIDGVDVYYKTKISNSLAFNTPIVDIPYYAGIRTIKMLDIKFIKMNNKVLRHLSISRQIGDKIISIIAPCCMDENDFLANVPSNYNAQKILSHSFDTLGYYGQGAGQLPTAQAMVQNAPTKKAPNRKEKENETKIPMAKDWTTQDEPIHETVKPTSAPAQAQAPEPEKVREITLEELQKAGVAFAKEKGVAVLKVFLTQMGASKICDIPKEKYQEAWEALHAWSTRDFISQWVQQMDSLPPFRKTGGTIRRKAKCLRSRGNRGPQCSRTETP